MGHTKNAKRMDSFLPIVIQPASEKDGKQILSMIAAGRKIGIMGFVPPASIYESISSGNISVAMDGENVVGFVKIFIPSRISARCQIKQIAVCESHRRRGIAFKLLHSSMLYFKEHGQNDVYTKVVSTNSASIALFASIGFTLANVDGKYSILKFEGLQYAF